MSTPSRALIVRSHQKDTMYIKKLQNLLLNVADRFIDREYRWATVRMSEAASKLVYYYWTTARCLQTLGEEYTGLVAVRNSNTGRLRVPSPMILNLFAFTQSLFAHCARAIIGAVLKYLKRTETYTDDYLYQLRRNLDSLLRVFDSLNSALFYLTGNGYRLAERFLGITYITIAPDATDHLSTSLFKVIGLVNLSRSVNDLWTILCQLRNNAHVGGRLPGSHEHQSSASNHVALSKCSLCLENPCRESTAAPCGHVFCWQCIVEAVQTTHECPLCRAKCHPSRLIHLANY